MSDREFEHERQIRALEKRVALLEAESIPLYLVERFVPEVHRAFMDSSVEKIIYDNEKDARDHYNELANSPDVVRNSSGMYCALYTTSITAAEFIRRYFAGNRRPNRTGRNERVWSHAFLSDWQLLEQIGQMPSNCMDHVVG